MIELSDVQTAASRIAGHVRRTPVMELDFARAPLPLVASVVAKLELLQITGSFKARGAMNRLLGGAEPVGAAGIVTASGGNHGLAVARTAAAAGVPAVVYVPQTTTQQKRDKIRAWGAELRVVGTNWLDSNAAALDHAAQSGAQYFHPFADPLVVAGQGTLALELLEQAGDFDTVVVAVGGGGLVSGVGTVLRALAPHIRVIAVEPTGSPTLRDSLAAGHAVTLPQITSRVATMSCPRTDDRIVEIAARVIDKVILVPDDAMQRAADWLWFEYGLSADLSGAAAIAALQSGDPVFAASQRICVIICGAGPEGVLGG